MAWLCKQCYADVTDEVSVAKPMRKFRCKCGSGIFIHQNDEPTVPYELTTNDKKLFLDRIGVASKE